jgi:hypothetical protein
MAPKNGRQTEENGLPGSNTEEPMKDVREMGDSSAKAGVGSPPAGNGADVPSLVAIATSKFQELTNFLREWEGDDRPYQLMAIEPDGKTEPRIFTGLSCKTWIGQKQGHKNLYFAVNLIEPRRLDKKATKKDISHLRALHVDVDPETIDPAERQQILDRLRAFPIKPTLIVFSGGGHQAFWKLKEAVPINGAVERFEEFNKALEWKLGGDHCHNIDRLMRLPYTVNLPNKKKWEKGRVPALAEIVEADWSRTYELSDFDALVAEYRQSQQTASAAPPVGEEPAEEPVGDDAAEEEGDRNPVWDEFVSGLPISARMKNLIYGIDHPEHSYKSRSERGFAVIIAMLGKGCTHVQIAQVFENRAYPISAHVLEQKSKD